MVETVLAPAHPDPFEPLLNQRRWGSRSFGAIMTGISLLFLSKLYGYEKYSWIGADLNQLTASDRLSLRLAS